MRKGLRAAIPAALLLMLLIVGYRGWGSADPERAAPVRDGILPEPVRVEPPEAGSAAGGPAAEPAIPRPDDCEPCVGGRVAAQDGTGVGGACVVAMSDDGTIRETAVTDADGRFEFKLRGRARIAIARYEQLGAAPDAEAGIEARGGDAVLAFEGIAGSVTAGDGSLMTRGVVLARFAGEDAIVANAPLSSRGEFAFYRLQPGRYVLTYKTHVYGSEYEMTDGGIDLEEWRTGVDLRLADGATIEGTVLDEAGAPKPKVWMRATRGSVLTGAYSNADGRFRIEGLVPDQTYLLTVWMQGFVPEQREVRAGERDVRFTLDPGLRSTGVLRGSDGLPVPGRQLVFRFGPGAETLLYATTDADGAFGIGGLPDERIEALVTQGALVPCGNFRAGERDVELRLPPP